MALPAQVQNQIKSTEEFYKQPDESDIEDGTTVEDGSANQSDNQASSDVPLATDDKGIPTGKDSEPPVNVSEGTPGDTTSEQKPKAISEEEFNALQRRHSSLQGMFNSTDSRLRQALEQIDQLRAAISTLQPSAGGTSQQQPITGPTEEEVKEYSPEFFNMLDRYTAAKLEPVRSQLDSMQQLPETVYQLQNRLQGVSSAQSQTAEQMFFADLEKTHPDWQAVNSSGEFAEWLQVPDSYTGITRQVYLDDARKRLDLGLVSNIFAGFKGSRTSTGTAAPNKSQKKDELRQQVSVLPTRNQAKAPDTADTAKTFTKADLDKLYVDERLGKYKGREAEFKASETELLDAIREGRYTG